MGNGERSGADERELLRRVYELAVRTRRLDERLWTLYRQGAAGFVLTARGHEVAQIASALAMRSGQDYAWPYYRDMGVALGARGEPAGDPPRSPGPSGRPAYGRASTAHAPIRP